MQLNYDKYKTYFANAKTFEKMFDTIEKMREVGNNRDIITIDIMPSGEMILGCKFDMKQIKKEREQNEKENR